MNFLLRIFAVGSLLTAVHSFASDSFEGKVAFAITSEKGKQMDLTYVMKEGKVRLETAMGGHQATMLTDLSKLETTMLMPEQNMYMVMPMKKPVEQEMA